MNPNKTNNIFSIGLRALRLLLALMIMSPTSVFANPNGGQVIAGLANIGASGSVVTIDQLTDRAIINWNGFSIDVGELTKFIQPSALSAVLNRVTGGDPSAIYGTIQANGQVYLINPNGVMVGPSGVINAQSFIASTLDVVVGQFMAGGDLLFSGSSLASVKNAGTINALGGDVMLIAHNLVNTGAINAANGTAALAAGSEVLLKSAGNERVFVQAGNGAADVGVDQKGQILAAAAELKAAGGNVYGLAINNEGVVRANGVENQGGRVFLTATGGSVVNAGEISAKQGDKGGEVRIAADNITLKDGSLIDVSGANGGGTALVGGDIHGTNPDMPNARNTTVEAGAVINADAVNSGNGGKVIVWADDTTNFQGNIGAVGGAANGDGGFAEVSGKKILAFDGFSDLRAPNGKTGTLLLDPSNLTIGTGSNQDIACPSPFTQCYPSDTTSAPSLPLTSYLNAGTLTDLLLSNSVVVTTVGSPDSAGQLGDITVASAIIWNNSTSLTLTAAHDIHIHSEITNRGSGSLTLNAASGTGTGIYLFANIITTGGSQLYNGAVILDQSEILASNNASITFNSTINGSDDLKSLTLSAGSGSVYLHGSVGAVAGESLSNLTISGTGTTYLYGSADPIQIKTSGSQLYNNSGVSINTNNAELSSSGQSIAFSGTVNSPDGHALTTRSFGDTTFSGAIGTGTPLDSLNVTTGLGTGNIYLNGGSIHTLNSQIYSGPVRITINDAYLYAVTGDISFGNTVGSPITVDSLAHKHLTTEVSTAGNVIFTKTVGAGDDTLASLIAQSGAGVDDKIYINGTEIITERSQEYNGNVSIGFHDAFLTSNTEGITFDHLIDSAADGSVSKGYGLTTHSVWDTTFGGAIGSGATGKLGFLDATVSNANYNIHLNGGVVNTLGAAGLTATGDQDYQGNVILDISSGYDTYLSADQGAHPISGGNISFHGKVDDSAAGDNALFIHAPDGDVTFDGEVGGLAALRSLSVGSYPTTIHIDGGLVKTTGYQRYYDDVELGANTILTSLATGDITFYSTLNSTSGDAKDLTVNTAGATTFSGKVGGATGGALKSLTTDAGGTTHIDGGMTVESDVITANSVKTTGAQTYGDAVELGNDTALNAGGAITFNSTVDSSQSSGVSDSHTLDATATAISFNGDVGVGSTLGHLNATATTINLNGAAGAIGVRTTGYQDYHGAVVLGGNATLLGNNAAAVTFDSTVNGAKDLTVNTNGATTFSGKVGNTTALASLTTNVVGTTHIDGGVSGSGAGFVNSVKTTGNQTYGDAVELGYDTVLASGDGTGTGNISFASTVNGTNDVDARSLAVNTAGITTFGGKVGYATALASLTTNTGGSTAINGGLDYTIKTVGGQTYGDAVTLGDNTGLQSTNSGNITFASTVNGLAAGDHSLAVYTNGATTFGGYVGNTAALTSLITDTGGTTHIDGGMTVDVNGAITTNSIKTTGAQTYGDAVELGDNTALNAGSITFNSTVNSSQTSGATDGHSLNATATTISFNGDVGVGSMLGSLTATGTTINLNGAATGPTAGTIGVLTSLSQYYHGAAVLGGNATLTSSGAGDLGNITFTSTVNGLEAGDHSLAVNTAGATTFGGIVGNTSALASLTTDAGGTTHIDGGRVMDGYFVAINSVRTTGAQLYGDAVELGNNTALYAGTSLTFSNTVNSAVNTTGTPISYGYDLTTYSGYDTTFNGEVGARANGQLGSLEVSANYIADDEYVWVPAVDSTAKIHLDGGAITTLYGQDYYGAVELGALTTLTAEYDKNGYIDFDLTVDGAYALTLHADDYVDFDASVGAIAPLASLSVTAPTIYFDGIDDPVYMVSGKDNDTVINTVGDQVYTGAVSIEGNDFSLTAGNESSAGNITFAGKVDADGLYNESDALVSKFGLTTHSFGNTTFAGLVGYDHELGYLEATAAGDININGGVDGLGMFTNGTINTVALGVTSGDQHYHGNVKLGADASLLADGDILFAGTVDSAGTSDNRYGLVTVTGYDTTFQEEVGVGKALSGLVSSAYGHIYLNGGAINTVSVNSSDARFDGVQHYHGNVVLGKDATLTAVGYDNGTTLYGGDINFMHSVDGAYALTTTSDGNTSFNGAVGSGDGTELAALTASISANGKTHSSVINFNGGTIETKGTVADTGTGSQVYNGDVMLQDNAVLTAAVGTHTPGSGIGEITFNGDLDSTDAGHSLDATATAITFNGDVGMGTTGGLNNLTATGTTINLNGAAGAIGVNTSGLQDYNGSVVLGGDATLLSSAGTITFDGTVDSSQNTGVSDGHTLNATATAISFNGDVGISSTLGSLTTNGTTNLNGAAGAIGVRTSGLQDYNGAVVLGGDATLHSINSTITFDGTVDSSKTGETTDKHSLNATATAITFNGDVGIGSSLGYLNATANTINLNGAATGLTAGTIGVKTYDYQDYHGNVILGGNATLTSDDNITFYNTVNSNYQIPPPPSGGDDISYGISDALSYLHTLTTNSVGYTTFNDTVGLATSGELGLLDVTAAGGIYLSGLSVETIGDQNYRSVVTLGNNTSLTTLTSGAITFFNVVNSGSPVLADGFPPMIEGSTLHTLTTNSVGNTTFNGDVGAGTYGELGFLHATVSGSSKINLNTANNFSNGTIAVETIGDQTYHGAVVLGANATLTAVPNTTSPTQPGAITFDGAVDSDTDPDTDTVSISNPFEGHSTTHHTLNTSSSGDTTFGGNVGIGTTDSGLGSLTANITASGKINLNGTTAAGALTVLTTGSQDYNGSVVLGGDATLRSTDDTITFDGTVDSSKTDLVSDDHSLNATATAISFNGDVGIGTTLGSLTATATTINLNGAAGAIGVRTSGLQDYNGAVVLGGNATLHSINSTITFDGTVDSSKTDLVSDDHSLNATATAISFNGDVGVGTSLGSLTATAATINLYGAVGHGAIDVVTSGYQDYHGAMVLGADANLLSSAGTITFDGTVNSSVDSVSATEGHDLTTYSHDDTTFKGAVGAVGHLGSLEVSADYVTDPTYGWMPTSPTSPKIIHLDGGSVTTLGGQDYYGAVELGALTTLTAETLYKDTPESTDNGYIDFDLTVNGAYGLTLDAGYFVDFDASVGAIAPLASLSVTAPWIDFDGVDDANYMVTPKSAASVIKTTGDQTYNGHVVLYHNDFSVTSTAGNIAFNGKVDDDWCDTYADSSCSDVTKFGLTTNSYLDTTFAGLVGYDGELGYLDVTVTALGNININGGAAGLTQSTNGTINTMVKAGTSGDQHYHGNVKLGADASLLADGDILFAGTVDSSEDHEYSLTATADAITFNGDVGIGTTAAPESNQLGFLHATAATINLNGSEGAIGVKTAGYQEYNGAVVLGGDATLNAGSYITFNGTVDSSEYSGVSARHSLDATAEAITFNGDVGIGTTAAPQSHKLGDLTATAATITLNGAANSGVIGVKTAGDQDYNGSVVLGNNANLYAEGSITFDGTVDSSQYSGASAKHNLTTYSDGDTNFNGDVGNSYELGNLYAEVGGEGRIHLNGSHVSNGSIDVHTSGYQYYHGGVHLGGDAYLTALGSYVYNSGEIDAVDEDIASSITFDGTVDSNDRHGRDLTTISSGDTSFLGNVGYDYRLGNFDIESLAGEIYLGNPDHEVFVNTYEDQSYTVASDNHVYLSGDAWLDSSRGGITFNAMVETNNYSDLNTYSWLDTDFNGNVGYDAELGNLYAEIGSASGRIHLSGTAGAIEIHTYGDQEYNGNVHVGKDVTSYDLSSGVTALTSSEGSISFDGTVNSYNHYDLEVNSDRDTTFWGAVGNGAYALGNLTINTGLESVGHLPGSIVLRGGAISTYGYQDYNGAVLLGADTTMIANDGIAITPPKVPYVGYPYVSAGDITFENTVDSEWGNRYGLTTQSEGDTTFYDYVGEATNGQLGYLTASADGYIDLYGGSFITSGEQNYSGDVWLDADTYMSTEDSDIAFNGYLNGAYDLTLETGEGNIALDTVGDLEPLSYNFIDFGTGNGIIALNGDVTSYGDQNYTRDVIIGDGITLDSSYGIESESQAGFQVSGYDNGGSINFYGTVNGKTGVASDLTLNAGSGYVDFDGAVGNDTALTSLTIEGTGTTYLHGTGSVNTTGDQTYEQAVEFHGDTAFTTDGGAVTFGDALNGRQELDGFSPQTLDQSYDYDLDINAKTGDITLDGEVNAGNITLAGDRITWNAGLSGADLDIRGENLIMNGDVSASGDNGVLMLAVDSFQNAGRHGIDGQYLVYSVSPTRNIMGGLGGSEQYGTTYVGGPAPAFSGSGFLYSIPKQLTYMNQHTYEGINNVIKFDVPQPGAGTHGGGFFSVIDTPTHTREYREEHKKKKDAKKGGQTSSAVGVFNPGRLVLASLASQGNPVLLQGQE